MDVVPAPGVNSTETCRSWIGAVMSVVTVGSRFVIASSTPSGLVKSALKTWVMSDALGVAGDVVQVGSRVGEEGRPRVDQLDRPHLHIRRRRH